MSSQPNTLASIVVELGGWPGGATAPLDGLAERLSQLVGRPHLDAQEVAWALDIDGRYSGHGLSEEMDRRRTGDVVATEGK